MASRPKIDEVTQREVLDIYDSVQRDLNKALEIIEDNLLPCPREALSENRLAKLEETHKKLDKSLRNLIKKRSKARSSAATDERFNVAWIKKADDHPAFFSQETLPSSQGLELEDDAMEVDD